MASYVYIAEVLILIFLKVPNVNAALNVTDTVFTATGENLGLSVQVDFTGEEFLTCIVDGEDQGEIIATNITSSSAVDAEFTANGRYTIVLSCFGDTEFNASYVDDFYIGDAITGINATIGLSGLVIPLGYPLDTDPLFEFSFSTGTDVSVEFKLPHSGWNHMRADLTNGTHNITIPASNFTPGLYTLSVNFTNPLEPSGITKYAVLALQEPVNVTNVVLKQYVTSHNNPTYIMVDQQLEVEISLSGGDNFTASLTMSLADENITAVVGSVCTGKTTLQSLYYTFNETDEYNLTVDVSNYVSNYSQVIPVVVIYEVNSFAFTVAPEMALYNENVTFTVTVGASPKLPMGDVTCYFDFGDGTVHAELFDSTPFSTSYARTFSARWYEMNITCSNQLPSVINSVPTKLEFYKLVKVANPVESLTLTHDSVSANYHPFSVPILFNLTLTHPGTDLPLANLTCDLIFQNNEKTETKETADGDVTDVSTITFSKTLPGGFTYNVSAFCYNFKSSGTFLAAENFTIYYDCWKTGNYFSTSLQDPTHPLLAKTNEDIKISASVFLSRSCNGTLLHYWSIYQSDGVADTFSENITNGVAGILNLAKYKMQAGLYKIFLTTYFTGYSPQPTLSDYVYVNYTLPALIISLKVDGADSDIKEVWRLKDTALSSTASYDPAVETNVQLSRQWSCVKGPMTKTEVVLFLENEKLEPWPASANADCTGIITQQGAESFVITKNTLSTGQWYLFVLTLNDIATGRTAKKAQALYPIDQEPLELQFVCQSNCYAGSGNIAVLALFNLELNIQVVTPGVQNDTLGYKWTLEMYDNSSNTYIDKSHVLVKDTSTGFILTKENMEDLNGSKYMVVCTVTATNFAPTTKSQLYRMNMAPYGGSCSLTKGASPVVASIDELMFSCTGWKDEGDNDVRSAQDNGGSLKYCLVQVFLTETLDVNTSIPAHVHECRVDSMQTFKLLKTPDDRVNTTRVEVRIKDHIELPYEVYNLGLFEVKRAVADDASGDAGAVAVNAVFESNMGLLESGEKTNSIDTISNTALVIADALPTNIPEPPVYEPAEDETGGGMITGVNEAGELLSAGDALDSLGKQEEDPTMTKCKEVTNYLAIAVFDTTKNQTADTKEDLTVQLNVVRAVTGLGVQAKNLRSDTMVVMSNIIEDVFNSTNKSEGGTPEHDSFLTDVLVMMGSVDSAFSPSSLKGTVDDVDLGDVRRRSQFESVFASDETIQKVEEGRMSLSEMEFIKRRIAFKNLKMMEERKSLCNNYSRNKSNYQKGIVQSVKISDGNKKSIGTEDSNIALTRDTSDKLSNTTLKSLTNKSSVKIPSLNGIGKASIAMLESKTTTRLGAKAGAVTSGEGTLLIDTDQTLDGKIKVIQKVAETTYQRLELVTDEDDANGFMYFLIHVKQKSDDLYFSIKPDSDSYSDVEEFEVYILYMESPDSLETEYVSKVKYTAKGKIKAPDWTVRFPPSERGENDGIYKVGMQMKETETAAGARKKREATNSNGTHFNFATATMACMTWDDSTDTWRTDECDGRWNPDTAELECDCKPKKELTFANSFYVAPNKIDFSSVFLKFSPLNQAAVMATLVLIFLIYIIIIIWTRRQDRKDLLKWGITPFSDNFSEDNYFYVIKVFTGLRPGAGTRSRICMVIAGEEMDSGVREVADGVREEFTTGSVMNFLMSTTVYLGDLEYIRIWHDNSGSGNFASWYLSKIEIHDVQRNESFTFLGERWLAVEKDDGLLECVLPVCKTENLNIFKNRFFLNAKENLADSHIWISVAYRPQASNFTRTQRASCALLFVMLTMISNAMFFRGSNEDNYETPAELQVGPFRFSLQQIYISFVCALIVTPATLVVIYLFKLSKIKVDPNETLYKPNSRASRYKIPFMNDWLEREQKRSIELERHLVQKGIPNSQSFPLPHWCTRIAWFIIIVTTFLCSFFIMLYSMEWGKQKSEEWITTFLMSFFESVFCLDPIKVGVMALMFALIFRSTKESQAPVNRSTIMKKYTTSLRRSGGLRLPAPPLDEKKLEKARNQRKRDLLMKRCVRDILVNIIIIWILFSISFSNRDVKSYYMHQEVIDRILQPVNMPSFSAIKTTSDFFDWLNTTAIISLFPEHEKDGHNTPLHWRVRQFMEGGTLFRVGPPRLRQLRTPKKSCTNEPFPTEDCFKKYQEPSEETGSYCIGWKDGECDPDEEMYMYSSNAWRFTSAFDIWGLPIAGYYTTYGGGGYIAELSVNRQVSQYIFEELFQNSWVDRQTRAVLFEFTLYCLNANIFTYNMFMVEFPETGGAFPYYVIFPMRVYLHQGPLGIYTLACEVLFVLYIIILTVMVIIQMVQQKKAFFKEGWQVFELIFIILSYVAIVMNIIQVVFTDISLDTFRNDKKAFVNFYHLAIWNTVLVLLIGVLVFMATIRTLNILGYNKRINAVAKIFTKAASDLVWFGLFFSYVFTCYAAFGFLLFGWKLKSYKNVFTTMGTLFISMIGKSRFTEIEETYPIFSKIYFMCFIFFVVYMILTMFLAVLSKAIDQVHAETRTDRGDEMVDYVLKKIKGLMSYGGKAKKGAVKPAPWNRKANAWGHKRRAFAFNKATNREILQEIRESMHQALTGNPRDFSTPVADQNRRQVTFRR